MAVDCRPIPFSRSRGQWDLGLRTDCVYRADSSLNRRITRSGPDIVLDAVYEYDGDGNTVSKVETAPGRDPVRTGYEYDFEDRLIEISVDGATNASYLYGADGSRILRNESGHETYYVYDPRDVNGYEDIVGEVNGTGGTEAKVVHGPGIDEPLGKFDRTEVPQGAWYYYHHDGLGSVTRLSRADKSMANRYVYDDFGRFRGKTEGNPNAYGFTGRESDNGGLTYLRARYYEAETGRFFTRDPAGTVADVNRYTYVDNNPINRQDPSGLGCLLWTLVCSQNRYDWSWSQFVNCASSIGLPSGALICLGGCAFACMGGGWACELCLAGCAAGIDLYIRAKALACFFGAFKQTTSCGWVCFIWVPW